MALNLAVARWRGLQMRSRRLRQRSDGSAGGFPVGSVVAVATLLLSSVMALTTAFATTARADDYYWPSPEAYAMAHDKKICNTVAETPIAHQIWAIVSIVMSQTNLNYKQTQKAIGYAIKASCPSYFPVFVDYMKQYP